MVEDDLFSTVRTDCQSVHTLKGMICNLSSFQRGSTAFWTRDFNVVTHILVTLNKGKIKLVCNIFLPKRSQRRPKRYLGKMFYNKFYYMAWLRKVNQILRDDCLPERSRWSFIDRSGFPVTRAAIVDGSE